MATITTTAAVLPSVVTSSTNLVIAQGQNMTGENAISGNTTTWIETETESLPSARETGCLPSCEIISE